MPGYGSLTGGQVVVTGGFDFPEIATSSLQFTKAGHLLEFLGCGHKDWANEVASHVARIDVAPYDSSGRGTFSHGSRSVHKGVDERAHVLTWSGESSSAYFFIEGGDRDSAIDLFSSFDFVESDNGVHAVPKERVEIPVDRPPTIDLVIANLGMVRITEASRTPAPSNAGRADEHGEVWLERPSVVEETQSSLVKRTATANIKIDLIAGTDLEWAVGAAAEVSAVWDSASLGAPR